MLRLKKSKNKLFCTITINNSDAIMMLDTGSNMSYISDSFAKNCKVVGRAKTAGQTGKLSNHIEVKELENIKIDNCTIESHNFLVIEKFKQYFRCDGVIGADILTLRNHTLDLKNNLLRYDTEILTEGVQFEKNMNKIYFDATVNGLHLKNLLFDTGASNLYFDINLARSLDLVSKNADPGLEIRDSNDHPINYESCIVSDFKLQSIHKSQFLAYLLNMDKSRKLKDFAINGIIGQTVLTGHTFKFDFTSMLCKIT